MRLISVWKCAAAFLSNEFKCKGKKKKKRLSGRGKKKIEICKFGFTVSFGLRKNTLY